ncbi:MAG TPA: hypothetical protein VEU30_13710 [Thermoanaerobaculia bacterium]|nr:hypothetical protein [Thermoanaerobaculia bacterium]
MRALFLAITMNVSPVAPVDILRFLRVPAIVWVMRRQRGRTCSDAKHRHPSLSSPRAQTRGQWRTGSA